MTQSVSHLFLRKMAVTMALFWVSLVLSVIGSNAGERGGEFIILHSPDSLRFSGGNQIPESLLKEVFSASLGLSVEENSDWKALSVIDPFNTPEAVVEVYVDGVSSLGESVCSNCKTYPLIADEYEPNTFKTLVHRIEQRFSTGGNKLVNIGLADTNELSAQKIFGDVKIRKVPKQPIEEDYQFLNELEALKAITYKVRSGVIAPDNVIDLYNFRFRSLHALCDYHGSNSYQAKEAKKMLGEALENLSKAFVEAYDGSVLVTAVVTNVAHTRRVIRDVEDQTASTASQKEDERDSDEYDDNYPAIFNIILWFGVVFSFTLIAIVYAIMDMDPGRDSIIYRMTNTRMKKDN